MDKPPRFTHSVPFKHSDGRWYVQVGDHENCFWCLVPCPEPPCQYDTGMLVFPKIVCDALNLWDASHKIVPEMVEKLTS